MFQILQKLRKTWGGEVQSFSLIGLTLAAILLISGCGNPARQGTSIQLSTWGSAQEVAVLKTLLAEFEKTHPCMWICCTFQKITIKSYTSWWRVI
jgi:hypothetical protein